MRWWFSRPRPARPELVVVEDPEDLGYRLVADPLLAVLSREEWRALEARAVMGPPSSG